MSKKKGKPPNGDYLGDVYFFFVATGVLFKKRHNTYSSLNMLSYMLSFLGTHSICVTEGIKLCVEDVVVSHLVTSLVSHGHLSK